MTLTTAVSISNCARLIEGTPYLLAEQRGDFVVADEPELDQVQAELPPVDLLVHQRLLKLLRCDALLFQEQFADADGHEWNTQNIT